MNRENWEEMFHYNWKRKGNSFIEFLLDAGHDVNAWNVHGETMLGYAARWGNLELTEFLVQKGAKCNIENRFGTKPIHDAALRGHKNIVKYYLFKGMSVDSCDNRKRTPLHFVAESYSVRRESCQEMVHFLVDSNANLEALDLSGHTPLLLAAQYGNMHVVELLVKLGANVDCCGKDQWTFLHHCSRCGCLRTVRFIVEWKRDIDLNARTTEGDTPMLLAVRNGNKDMVKLFLELGADPNCSNDGQRTVLHYAATKGWLDVVKDLVNAGCDLDASDDDGCTALHMAVDYERCDIAEFLLEKGASVVGGSESYVLHRACHNAFEERWLAVVKTLVEKGCNINARDIYHGTPLYRAVYAHNTGCIAYLLEAGADWNLKNEAGETAFNSCILRRDYFEGVVLFIEKGAYFNYSDYVAIMDDPLLKQNILQNVNLCTQAAINHFNNAELPEMYKIPVLAERLPSIEKLKFASDGSVAQDIVKTLNNEIQAKGYCNPLNIRPISLSGLCVRSLLEYYN